jgi:hypothetical protein
MGFLLAADVAVMAGTRGLKVTFRVNLSVHCVQHIGPYQRRQPMAADMGENEERRAGIGRCRRFLA